MYQYLFAVDLVIFILFFKPQLVTVMVICGKCQRWMQNVMNILHFFLQWMSL